MYPEIITTPEAELIKVGFISIRKPEEVANYFDNQKGTALLLINSLCDCSAADARLGVKKALAESTRKPDQLLTIFSIDQEALDKAAKYIKPYPMSSPAVALFKDGTLIHFVERHQMKGRSADMIANNLKPVLEAHC